jgi:hypothetical protein
MARLPARGTIPGRPDVGADGVPGAFEWRFVAFGFQPMLAFHLVTPRGLAFPLLARQRHGANL